MKFPLELSITSTSRRRCSSSCIWITHTPYISIIHSLYLALLATINSLCTCPLQNCLVIPEDEGYTVHASTQWPMGTHAAIATVLNIPQSRYNNTVLKCSMVYISVYITYQCIWKQCRFYMTCSVNVFVKRVGGAYGAKSTRSPQIAAACALASYVSRRWGLIITMMYISSNTALF